MSRRGSVVEARFPIEHRKRSSEAGGQCLGGWPPLAAGWHAGPRTLKGAGARKICRDSNVLHVNYTSEGAKPGDDLSSGSWFKIKRSNIWAEVGIPPPGARLKMEAALSFH